MKEVLTSSAAMVLEEDVTNLLPTDILTLLANAVAGSPALWNAEECRRRGSKPRPVHPDHAVFDLWLEHPGTGWYQMCQEAGMPGYDGIHPAWALELDDCWLSWNQSSDSLEARLTRDDES